MTCYVDPMPIINPAFYGFDRTRIWLSRKYELSRVRFSYDNCNLLRAKVSDTPVALILIWHVNPKATLNYGGKLIPVVVQR